MEPIKERKKRDRNGIKRGVLIGFLGVFLLNALTGFTQDTTRRTSEPCYRCRLRGLLIGETVVYSTTIYGLSKAWYNNPLTNFHFFNDNHEWLQIDKVGHMLTAYQIARISAQAYRWTGLSDKKAALYAGLTGLIFQTPIEILDGFSPEYGFSVGDMAANIAGPALYTSQYLAWGELRIQPKFSFHNTPLYKVRKELLGSTWHDRWLKDYNGQTYWLSVNPSAFGSRDSKFPRWLNVAAGYGIQDMVAAETPKSIERGYRPYRQYYLSLDIDFTRIKTRHKALKTVFFLLNTLKIPAPTLEYNGRNGFRFHALYF
ncbi:DUF2279 domain-containing protein [Larkinella rosea]|uniref:DUF2279 domain-containing protein n=1 Tax=Larkinella rosea TaxID=2025312 RepID=A0A3P1C1E0_9BACT|nr:DUF2279 domain-containing protein [Larkinella rosea]RRB06594.1 DUF2279 domain-containing protein [Larkinella rosea]